MINVLINEQIIFYVLIATLVIILILIIWNIRLEIKMRRLLRGKNAKTLEDTIIQLNKETDFLNSTNREIEKYLKDVERRLKRSIQGTSTVRFNPFKGVGEGGNQSFATAFVNEEGNGVVISSIYSRDRMSVYSKPLVKYKSEYELTKEEKSAIKEAKL
jgi:hypothetical protein